MKAYKLFRLKKDGNITSLFIDKSRNIPKGQWLQAFSVYTEGFKYRPGWHCLARKCAPHLSKKNRVWAEVEIKDFDSIKRPKNHGGLWFLASKMKVNRILV